MIYDAFSLELGFLSKDFSLPGEALQAVGSLADFELLQYQQTVAADSEQASLAAACFLQILAEIHAVRVGTYEKV